MTELPCGGMEIIMNSKITGEIFAGMITSGANNLYNNREEVNELNVFPVPDGDTGTNMSLTITAVSAELAAADVSELCAAADKAAFAALRGARGNSGVILSQFFRGISRELKGKTECGTADFACALQSGSDAAYKAVMQPTEGTILTVAKAAAKGAVSKAMTEEDAAAVIEAAVSEGEAALERTPEQLPALKEAGVVDAGGKGWMLILEGMLHYLKTGGAIEKEGLAEQTEKKPEKPDSPQKAPDTGEIAFRYCTEFIIEKSDSADTDGFRAAIAGKGDCMLVIDDDDIVKVHIHTNHPGFVIEEAIKCGELINLKIDNMKHQHKSILQGEQPKTKVVTKSKQKKTRSEAVPEKEYGIAAVSAGKGFSGILKDLGADKIIEGGQTMNPSAEDILKSVAKINAKTVFVFPNNKNIIMAAEQAAELSDKKVIVIPTKNLPQCVSALVKFSESKDAEQNKAAMLRAMDKVGAGQVTYAVRDTEIEGRKIKKGDILGLADSKIESVGKNIEDVAAELTDRLADEDSEIITVYYGKGVKSKTAAALGEKLGGMYPDAEVSVQAGGQPVYYYIISVE